MCTQCLTEAELLYRSILPHLSLMQAKTGIDEWPAGWYGLVDVNDPLVVFEGPLVANPTEGWSDDAFDQMSADVEQAYDRYVAAVQRLEASLKALPAMVGYTLVKACVDAGYDEAVHGSVVSYWLMHHLASKAVPDSDNS